MPSFDDIIKGFFALSIGGIVAFVYARWREMRIQQAINERDHIEIDIHKIKNDLHDQSIVELIATENGELRRRRAEHKSKKGD